MSGDKSKWHDLGGALRWSRTPGEPQKVGGQAPDDAPVTGSGDDVSSSGNARILTWGILVIGVVVVLVWHEDESKVFVPAAGLSVFAGFYVAAQAIERVLELLPPGTGTKQAKANRAMIFAALGFLIAVFAAESMHLYFVSAVGAQGINVNLDVLITALAIGGGTKPLHDLIKQIEKAKAGSTT